MGLFDVIFGLEKEKGRRYNSMYMNANTRLLVDDVINSIETNVPNFDVIFASENNRQYLTIKTESGEFRYVFSEHNFRVSSQALDQLMHALEEYFQGHLSVTGRDCSEDPGREVLINKFYGLDSKAHYARIKANSNKDKVREC